MRKEYTIKSRGLYPPKNGKPFKVSRSQIDRFVECPRCYWLDQRRGIRRPSMPAFTIHSFVDRLLKTEFDECRRDRVKHPLMEGSETDWPFNDCRMNDWRMAQRGVQHLHAPTGLLIAGAIDDVWERDDGLLFVVDYKATAKTDEVNIDADWQDCYKRQMEVYQWLLRQQNLPISDVGYFLYCNGQNGEAFDHDVRVIFTPKIIPYAGSDAWIEPTLLDLKRCLDSNEMPDAPADCEYCGYVEARAS